MVATDASDWGTVGSGVTVGGVVVVIAVLGVGIGVITKDGRGVNTADAVG
jgi:hypothetical protein